MKLLSIRQNCALVLILGVSILSACEGESRPFQESVEVETLGLVGITVTLPANAQETFFINSGQSVQLGLSGRSDVDTSVNLSTSDRSWRTSNAAVISVSENGVVTGGTDGTAEVAVSIGGIQSERVSITVSNATLTSIQSIEGDDDSDDDGNLERCIPGNYFAVGLFDDQSTRTLFDATFTLGEDSNASLPQNIGTAIVNATTPGAVTLIAQLGDLEPFSRQLTVLDTLVSIAVTPETAEIDENETQDFIATGTYNPAGSGGLEVVADSRSEIITANVEWAVTSGTSNASVDNSGENRGQVRGLSEGTATLRARCSTDREDTAIVTVIDVAADDSDELSFENVDGTNALILDFPEQRQLRVSRGSEYNSEDEETVADGVRFSVPSTDLDFIDQGALENGVVRPLVQGVSVRVTAELLESGEVVASGSITIDIQ